MTGLRHVLDRGSFAFFRRVAIVCLVPGGMEVGADEGKNELMPLRIRKVERMDREMVVVKEGTVLEKKKERKEVDWESERLSGRALAILKKLVKPGSAVEEWLAADFLGESPVPEKLRVVESTDSGWQRWVDTEDHHKKLGRREFVGALRNRLRGETRVKVTGIVVEKDEVRTEVYVESCGDDRQATARWGCRWVLEEGGGMCLRGLEREGYEELRGSGKGEPVFVDATAEVLGGVEHFSAQIQRGMADWAGEISRFSDMALTGHHGIAVGDVDGDGREDVFVCDGGGCRTGSTASGRMGRRRTFRRRRDWIGMRIRGRLSSSISTMTAIRIWWWPRLRW